MVARCYGSNPPPAARACDRDNEPGHLASQDARERAYDGSKDARERAYEPGMRLGTLPHHSSPSLGEQADHSHGADPRTI
jgi:hypothetical protein